MKINWASSLFVIGLLLATGLARSADRFSYSEDGSQVTDSSTGLTWKRCAEGMTWSGSTCTDTAITYTHEAALQLGINGWRLPNIKELVSMVDDSRINPAIDPAAFPNTPSNWFWTSSPYVGNSSYAWHVDFDNGNVSNGFRRYGVGGDGNYVRLVR